ncbi:MAG: hypothetical protein ACK559_38660, partial [bacterium]
MQLAERPGDRLQRTVREGLDDLRVVQRLVLDQRADLCGEPIDLPRVRLPVARAHRGIVEPVASQPHLIGIGVADALVALARDAFGDRRIDPHLRAGGHDPGGRHRQAG